MQYVRSWRARAVSLLLAAVMVLGFLPALPGGEAEAHWADDYLAQMADWGLIRADQVDSPNDALTRADFMSIVNRAYGYHVPGPTPFEDVSEYDWFYDDVGIAYTAKYIQGTSETTASPNDPLDRETAATILGRNMMLQDSPGEIMDFSDARQISNWSRGTIKASLEHYLVSGYDDGTFRPQRDVSWGEMAALMSRTIGTPIQAEGDYTLGGVFGNVTISSPGVTLRDTVISGDLYVTGGVGLGNIKLENVTVLGRIIASGTGESESGGASILMRNVIADELLVDNLQDNYVTIQADGITEIGKTTVRTSAYIEDNTPDGLGLKYIELNGDEGIQLDLAGRVEEVVNKTPGSLVQAAKGTVAKLTVDEDAVNATLDVNRGAEVKELNLDVATNVTGQGDVEKLNVNAPGSIVTMLPDEIQIRPGITAVINGQEMDSTGADESSREPLILSGYPMAADVAPNSISAVFATNKRGTIHWAVSAITDGSVGVDDLIKPPAYGSIAVQRGTVLAPQGDEEVTAAVTGLLSGGSYYLSAVLVDERGNQSPLKVIAFTTPDDTVPAFNQGYPYMSKTSRTMSQVVVSANKACVLYYALYPQGATAPTADDLKTASVAGSLGYGVHVLEKNTELPFQINDRTLEEQETYVVYFWLTDANGANSSAVTSLTFTTADETPPTFITKPTVTNVQANSVGLTFRLSENGVVFWAVVEEGAIYPKAEPGQTGQAPLDSDYAKLQVSSGLNALVSGRVNATEAADGTINVTGLQPETSYDLYYVAQDAAGNYSITVEKITINTLDNTGPKISQRFSKYSGLDDTMNPMPDTDIILEFSENVCSTGTVGQDFLALYQATKTAPDKDQAIKNLRDALAYSITLYQQGTGTGRPQAVKVRSYPYVEGEKDWVIDFAQAKVESKDGKILLTFPSDALNLSSGSTYYFAITNLTDNSTAKNPVVPSTVDYNQASVAQGHKVPRFTVVFAQVYLTSLDLGTGTLPYERDDKIANSKPNGTPTGAAGTTDDDLADVDASFRMVPISTSKVEDNMSYDMLIWSDTTMEFDLFYRVVDKSGAVKTSEYPLPNMEGKTVDSHGWVLLGGSGQVLAAAGEERGGKSVNKQFNGCVTAASFPPLNKLDDGGDAFYEFGISVTRIGTSGERNTWSGDVNFYVNVASSTGQNLLSLANGISQAGWERFLNNGLGGGGGASIGSVDDGSDTLHLFHTFTDTQVPRFDGTAPQFTAGDTFVDMRVNLDRACTVYYVIAPVASLDRPLASVSTTVENPTGTFVLDGDILTQFGEFIKNGGAKDPNKVYGTTGTYTESNWVQSPQKLDIVQPKYTETEIKKGNFSYSGGQGYQTETVKDLLPLTDYYVYFVLRGASQEMSQVYLYTFKTVNISKPIIQLTRNVSGVVGVATHVNSILDYNIVTSTQWNTIMNNQLTKVWYDSFTEGAVPTDYTKMTILEAMMATYTVAGATAAAGGSAAGFYIPNDSTTVNYSVFDVYAKQSVKDDVAELIRAGSSTAGSIAGEQIEPRENYTPRINVDERSEMTMGTSYVFLAVAHHESGTIDSFKAIDNVSLPDTEPPAPINITTYLTKDPENGEYTGNVTITFDKNLYWMPSASGSADSAKPVYNAEKATDGKGVGILEKTGYNFELKPFREGNTATSTFNINFSGVRLNGTIIIFEDGVISNSSGVATTEKLTLTFVQQAGGNNQSGLPIQNVGFTAQWGGRDVPAKLVPITLPAVGG